MEKMKSVWVLADDRIGNINQALGVAEATGFDFSVIKVLYNSLIKLPNFIIGATKIGITKESLADIKEPWPNLVIAAGRRSSNLARYIKKQSNGKSVIVQIMYPGFFARKNFDLIAVPKHDNLKFKSDNILEIIGAPHRITKTRLLNEKEKWQNVFSYLKKPYTVLLVGGATKNKPFTVEMAEDLGTKANLAAEGGSLLITTSRRTGEEQTKALLSKITVPSYVYNWSDKKENPYFGYLSLADKIIVTGDSVSMCTEACYTDAEVYIYAPYNSASKKHQTLHKILCDNNYAEFLSDDNKSFSKKRPLPNSADLIAQKIKQILINKGLDLSILEKKPC